MSSEDPGAIPKWVKRDVGVSQPPFHHWKLGEHYSRGASKDDILRDLVERGGDFDGPSPEPETTELNDEIKVSSLPRKSVVKGYELTAIEEKPLKEEESDIDRFTRRWHTILYPGGKMKNFDNWLNQVEALILKKDDMKEKYDLVATSPSGVAYEKGDRVALVLAYEFMKAFDQTTDDRDPLFWLISRSFAKKHDILKFDSSQPLHTFARLTLMGGLLYLGYNPDAKDRLGYSPLHYATSKGYAPSVYLLLRWKANPDCQDNDTKWTPLHVTAEYNQSEIAELLCQHGAHPDTGDTYGDKPIHFATLSNAKETIDVLLRYGGDPDARGDQDNTPLHMTNNDRIAGTLLDHGADIHARDRDGNSSLHIAAYEGNEPMVRYLLDRGSDPEKENYFGDTPLDYAAMSYTYKAIECFRIIFEAAKDRLDDDYVNHTWKNVRYYVEAHDDEKAADLIRTKLSKVALHICMVSETKDGQGVEPGEEKVWSLVQMLKESRKGVSPTSGKDPMRAIFDKVVFGHKVVVADVMEADQVGNLPGTKAFSMKGGSVVSNLVKQPKLGDCLADHPALRTYINYKWKQYAMYYYWRDLLFYLFQMIMLTFALMIAARPELNDITVNQYSTPLDIWRAICEVVTVLLLVVRAIEEIIELVFFGFKVYLKGGWNYVTWVAIFLTVLIIPFRAAAHHGQWVVAALAYIAWGAKAFEYATLFRLTGSYLHALWVIIRRDLSKFLLIFFLVLMTFSGAFYLSLRYDDTGLGGPNADLTRLPEVGNLPHEVYLTGFRTMVQYASVFSYLGAPNGIRALGVIIYLSFMFVVFVLLLNALIAMMVGTYLSLQSSLDSFFMQRCRYIARVEREVYPFSCCRRRSDGGCRTLKELMYRDLVWPGKLLLVDHPQQNKMAQIKRRMAYTRDSFARKFLKPYDTINSNEEANKIERRVHVNQVKLQNQLAQSAQEMAAMRRALEDIQKKLN